jgi:hypothetical protein
MKYLLLALLLILFSLSLLAQESTSCAEAAEQASTIIDSAQLLLDEGNAEGASTLLDAAQTLLDNCYTEEDTTAPPATVQDAATLTSSATPAALATLASPATVAGNPSPETTIQTISTGGYSLTAPAIDENNSIAFVRFAHTSVDAGPIDIYMGRDNLLVVSNLAYAEATDFVPINAGERSFRARRHGSGPEGEVLYHVSWNYLSNSSWIVTAAGLADEFAFIVEPISVIRNEYNEQARVRVVNLVAGAPRMTVSTDGGEVLGNGLGWVGIRDNLLSPGSYTLQGSTADGASFPEALQFDFEANVTYTLYVMGRGTAEEPLRILNIVSPADTTQVLFRNNGTAPVDLHYRPSNLRLLENLTVGSESAWVSLYSGAYTFITYAPGTGPTGQELAATAIQLRPGRYMIFEIVGNQIDLSYEGLNLPAN